MKNNLVYILTLITIVVALNYIHIHSDPYPNCHDSEEPFFSCWLKESHNLTTLHMNNNNTPAVPHTPTQEQHLVSDATEEKTS